MDNKPVRPPPGGHSDWWNRGVNPALSPNSPGRRAAPREFTAQEQAVALRDLHENGFQ